MDDLGDSRNVIKRFLKNDKFKEKYKDEFIEEIKININKDKTYVGEFEVSNSETILYNCDIILEKFTNSKDAKKYIESATQSKKNKSIYLILDQDGEHWEYFDV